MRCGMHGLSWKSAAVSLEQCAICTEKDCRYSTAPFHRNLHSSQSILSRRFGLKEIIWTEQQALLFSKGICMLAEAGCDGIVC